MRYSITESRLEGVIEEYLDKMFDVKNINWSHPWGYNEHGEEDDEEGEDENRIQFYIGDYEDGDNNCFKWYACDYFTPESYARDHCPTVIVESPYDRILNGYFGDIWHEPFAKWFTKNFDLPIKTVEWM